jgi:hypothetical protein
MAALVDTIREEKMMRAEPDFVHWWPAWYTTVTSLRFEMTGGFLILLNAFLLGAQLSQRDRFSSKERREDLKYYFSTA